MNGCVLCQVTLAAAAVQATSEPQQDSHCTCVSRPFFSCTLSSLASFLKLVFFMSSIASVASQQACLHQTRQARADRRIPYAGWQSMQLGTQRNMQDQWDAILPSGRLGSMCLL